MRKILASTLLALCLAPGGAHASDATKADAVAMVKKGITFISSTSSAMSWPVRPHSSLRQSGSVITVGPASKVKPSFSQK